LKKAQVILSLFAKHFEQIVWRTFEVKRCIRSLTREETTEMETSRYNIVAVVVVAVVVVVVVVDIT
jgi:hypothetical protein